MDIENAPDFFDMFQLSITRALRDQLMEHFEDLQPVSLSERFISELGPGGGVYQLFCEGALVYVGKSDYDLADRLRTHRKKLASRWAAGRTHALIKDITFKCLYVKEDLSAVAPENALINSLREGSRSKGAGAVVWNVNGFGSKDPGKERDTTKYENWHFDIKYPIMLGGSIDLDASHLSPAALAKSLKKIVPYNFRFGAMPSSGTVSGGGRLKTDVEAYRVLAQALPEKWSVVALPGYVISYPKDVQDFPAAQRWWRPSPGGGYEEWDRESGLILRGLFGG